MVVHDRENADGHGENARKFLEPPFDPFPTVERSFAEQERAPHAARDAVIPAGYAGIDEMCAGHRRPGAANRARQVAAQQGGS